MSKFRHFHLIEYFVQHFNFKKLQVAIVVFLLFLSSLSSISKAENIDLDFAKLELELRELTVERFIDNYLVSDQNQRINIFDHLGEAYLNGSFESKKIAKVFCLVDSWSTSSDTMNLNIQKQMYINFSNKDDIYSSSAYYTDCAMANLKNTYAGARNDIDKLQTDLCDYDISSKLRSTAPKIAYRVEEIKARLSKFSTGIQGIESQIDTDDGNISYYPTRSSLLIAMMEATIAISKLKAGASIDEVRGHFKAAANEINEFRSADTLNRTRNGWRLQSDLEFHFEFYNWLADPNSSFDVEKIISLPTVLTSGVSQKIDRQTEEAILAENSSYVDLIYLERLLPGIQETSECSRWRERSYEPKTLVSNVEKCLDVRPENLQQFLQLDNCLSKFEADDWYINLATGGILEASRCNLELERVTNKLRSTNSVAKEIIDEIADNLTISGSRCLISTQGSNIELTTSTVRKVRNDIENEFPKSLFGRPKQY